MPNVYKRKHNKPKISDQDIAKAINKIKSEGKSIRSAAKEIGMHESTLRDKMKVKRLKTQGGQLSIPHESEKELAMMLDLKAKWGFACSRDEVKDLVRDYVKANKDKSTTIGEYLTNYCKFKVRH